MTQPDIKALEEAIESAWQNTDIGGEPCLSFGNEKQREDFEKAARAHLQSLKTGTLTVQELEGMRCGPFTAPPDTDKKSFQFGVDYVIDKVIGRVNGNR